MMMGIRFTGFAGLSHSNQSSPAQTGSAHAGSAPTSPATSGAATRATRAALALVAFFTLTAATCGDGSIDDPNDIPNVDGQDTASDTANDTAIPDDDDDDDNDDATDDDDDDNDSNDDDDLPTCITIDRQSLRQTPPANLQVRFRVLGCEGEPLPTLPPEAFSVINDVKNEDFNDSLEGGGRSGVGPRNRYELYTILTLDMSDSIFDSDNAEKVVQGAAKFVEQLVTLPPIGKKHKMAIFAFGRPDALELVQDFTSNTDDLNAALGRLLQTGGRGTTDLYGAYIAALDHFKTIQQDDATDVIEQFMMIITDGVHEAGDDVELRSEALAKKQQSEASIFSVGIRGRYDESRLRELASSPRTFVYVDDVDDLAGAFTNVATAVEQVAASNYVAGICTPVARGDATVTIRVNYKGIITSKRLAYDASELTGEIAGCDPELLANPCGERNCGPDSVFGDACGFCSTGELCGNTGTCSEIDAITAGGQHTCALLTDGSASCWGDNRSEQADPPATLFTQLSAGAQHTCALQKADAGGAAITCWGANDKGQSTPPVGIYTRVSAGFSDTCAIRSGDGAIVCWGAVLGALTPPRGKFTDIVTGFGHACALDEDGRAVCFGKGTAAEATIPSATFVELAAGNTHTCGLTTDGAVLCWGANQLDQSTAPTGDFTAVSAGGDFGCAIRELGGRVACWGSNAAEQATPPRVEAIAVTSGGAHACALDKGKNIICWGANDAGQSTPSPVTE